MNELQLTGGLESVATWWMWAGFGVFVIAMLAVDMLLLGRKGSHKVGEIGRASCRERVSPRV